MLKKHPHLLLWVVGALGGALFGMTYWFGWGCRNCAKDNSPLAIVVMCVVAGAVMGRVWGEDHLGASRR